ncbi:MAG TPA: toll/interleukin-1 receptor domain-containing protein [Parasegetibacter sp.]
MKISNSSDFLQLIKSYISLDNKARAFQSKHFEPEEETGLKVFERVELKEDLFFSNVWFESCEFRNCKFEGVKFSGGSFSHCEFHDCVFLNCDILFVDFFNVEFTNVLFSGGTIGECVFADVSLVNTTFFKCRDLIEIRFGNCSFSNAIFEASRLSHLTFETLVDIELRKLNFKSCHVEHCTFYWFNLDHTVFENCSIDLSVFNNSRILPTTFSANNTTSHEKVNLIDLQTILKSEIEASTLELHFGIHNSAIRSYILEMVSKMEMHTVFISYSFCDKVIANRINEALKARGVFTFLWEKDSPAGQRLKKIMSYNVNKFDKLLFIASQNSLKSEACHFELSNGRKKQEKYWDLVLFPIHIDNFLFEVDEEDIPRKARAEFWKNIEELREINSLDFSAFNSADIDQSVFEVAIDRLVKALRKNYK